MRYAFTLLRMLLLLLALAAVTTAGARDIDYGAISSAVAQVMEEGHYSRQRVNPEISRQFLANYLHDLDEDHLYFTQKDIDAITAAHADTLARDVLAGRTSAAFEIFDIYKKRVNERMEKIQALLKTGLDFTGDRTVELSREHSPWPVDEAQADQLWHDQITGELLDEKLNGSKDAECVQTVA